MKWRLGLLAALLGGRIISNFLAVGRYDFEREVRVRLNYDIVERTGSECLVRKGVFWSQNPANCALPSDGAVLISGRLRADLIDRLLGRIWLDQSSNFVILPVERGMSSWRSRLGDWVESGRTGLVARVLSALPSPEGELVLGVVMGYKSILPRAFYDQLVRSGTIHLVVASGYNVMIVASAALSVGQLVLRRRMATIAALVMVLGYVIMSGGGVSLVRATLMGGMVLFGLAWGRGSRVIWSLLLTAGVMVALEPVLLESISFQLSVAATFGVAVVGPWLLKKWGKGDRLELTTTLGAIVSTAPVLLFHFGAVSLMSLASNVVLLPLMPLLMFLGGLTVAAAVIFPALLSLVSWPSYALAHLVVVLISFFG